MRLHTKIAATVAAIATLSAAGAQAATLFDFPGATGEIATNTTAYGTFAGAAGLAQLSFTLDGYASLDGQNWYEDDFTLTLNSTDILSGTFNLGGGGNDVTFFQPAGSTINNISGNGTDVTWAGGKVVITTPLMLQAGLDTLYFTYTSLGPDHAGFQGTGDEGWGVEKILVTQSAGVPEPATWGLMMVGFGSLGMVLRRQRRLQPALARI